MSLKCSDATCTASRSYRVTPDFSLPNTGTCMEVAGKGCKKTSGPTSYKAGDSSPSLWTVHEQHEYHTQANEYHNARKARTLARNKYEHGRSRHTICCTRLATLTLTCARTLSPYGLQKYLVPASTKDRRFAAKPKDNTGALHVYHEFRARVLSITRTLTITHTQHPYTQHTPRATQY